MLKEIKSAGRLFCVFGLGCINFLSASPSISAELESNAEVKSNAEVESNVELTKTLILPSDVKTPYPSVNFTFLNQTWLRFSQNNDGSMRLGESALNTLDIGLRRTRFQLFGNVHPKVFYYMQFGQNNFNSMYNIGSNRKNAFFVHDAITEYQVTKNNGLKIGGGLGIANGLSRFSQPSIGTISAIDVPVFAQATVDQIDQFSRKLSIYARGQVGKFDYRFVLSDPFPVSSNGTSLPAVTKNAQFSPLKHKKQLQGYLMYQFFEHEGHSTPYMTGNYLGSKKVWNVAAGAIYQPQAMYRLNSNGSGDTIYESMKLFCLESFLDIPLKNKSAIHAYLGYFNMNYGSNYLRMNGIMNPVNATNLPGLAKDVGPQYGNSLPMFGTGQTIYSEVHYLLPQRFNKMNVKTKETTASGVKGNLNADKNISEATRFGVYATANASKYDRLKSITTIESHVGLNCFIQGHQGKLTLDLANRPQVLVYNNLISQMPNLWQAVLQYQIFLN